MKFDYEIKHIKGPTNVVADALSRVIFDDDIEMPKVHFSRPCMDVSVLAAETLNDQFLSDIRERVIHGRWSAPSARERPFKKIAWELTIDDDGLIRRGSKVVPPASMLDRIFKMAHQSHCGAQATMRLIEREFWWPQMRSYVERRVRACGACRNARFRSEDTTHSWPKDEKPWTRLHMDWAQSRCAGNILVMVDTFSGWLEAAVCPDRKATTVIGILRAVFARFGIPMLMVTDNAPEFAGGELRTWLKDVGCRLMHSPEFHPQSNGSAERMVRVVKDALKCFNPNKATVTAFLHRVLFVHRNTAQRDGKSPAEILLGRSVRCPIATGVSPMDEILYRRNAEQQPIRVRYLYRQGANTSVVARKDNRTMLAHDTQLSLPQQDCDSESELEDNDGPTTRSSEASADSGRDRDHPTRDRVPPQFYGDLVMY
jgi:transposase InsO family protein